METKPNFLLNKPEPKIRQRLYNGRKLMVWDGKVKIQSIKGWVDNPRIELAKKKMQQLVGERELAQDEIFDLMKNDPEVKLKELRDDIVKNGLREPLTLSHAGKLLDGNRRFFAIKFALDNMPSSDPNRQDLEVVEAFVLTEDATEEDERNVLVEENFSASLKIEWPDYVKSLKVVEAHEAGMAPADIAERFNWSKSKIKETLKIHELIEEFILFATAPQDRSDETGGGLGINENEAETIAAKNYQYFNEAQKSFFDALKTDFEFKIQFFKWIHEEKFSSFSEVRVAYKAWKHPEAKAALLQPDPAAAKSAKAILDYNARVIQTSEEIVGRIDNFVKFIQDMTAKDIKHIPDACRERLQQALELIVKLTKASSK